MEIKINMNKITVLGSMNLDTTIRTERLPKPGETVHSKEMFTGGGGKGANQAIAAARNGGEVRFIGAVGKDTAGKTILELLEQDDINAQGIKELAHTHEPAVPMSWSTIKVKIVLSFMGART